MTTLFLRNDLIFQIQKISVKEGTISK